MTTMVTSTSSAAFFGLREGDQNQMKQQHSSAATWSAAAPTEPAVQKKRRNQPGTPSKYRTIL
ncbi:hypothetical protein U1Q18_029807 [Sarracenia purpurea var. burkii]